MTKKVRIIVKSLLLCLLLVPLYFLFNKEISPIAGLNFPKGSEIVLEERTSVGIDGDYLRIIHIPNGEEVLFTSQLLKKRFKALPLDSLPDIFFDHSLMKRFNNRIRGGYYKFEIDSLDSRDYTFMVYDKLKSDFIYFTYWM